MERVSVGECRCPGAPHPEDWVDLYSSVPIAVGAAVMQVIRTSGDDELKLQAGLARAYTLYGIHAWSFVDEHNSPVPVDSGDIAWSDTVTQLLPWDRGGADLTEVADRLYSQGVLRPLLSRTSKSLPGGQMDGSTSATQASGQSRQKRSKQSSRIVKGGRPSADPDP